MTVIVSRPKINLRDELNRLNKPSGIKGGEVLKADSIEDFYNTVGLANRNLIINGAMEIAQRGTSFTAEQWHLDRWYCSKHNGAFTVSQQPMDTYVTGEMAQFSNFLRMEMTSASTTYLPNIQTRVENVKLISGGKYTLSFYIRTVSSVQVTAYVYRVYGAGGGTSGSILSSAVGHTAGNGWKRMSITFDAPPTAAPGAAGHHHQIYLQFPINQTYTVDVTGIQLERGTVATPFEFRSLATELQMCQRYYTRINVQAYQRLAIGYCDVSNRIYTTIALPTQMRTSPSVGFSNLTIQGSYTVSTIDAPTGDKVLSTVFNLATSPLTVGTMYQVYSTGTGYIEYIAELV